MNSRQKILIVGLGNPGSKYQKTRHNAGFQVLDMVAAKLGLEYRPKTAYKADWAEYRDETSSSGLWLGLAKPTTFMNSVGKSVLAIVKAEGLFQTLESSVVVVYDDLDIPVGQYKKTAGVGPKIHNGLLSIQQELRTLQFTHYRVGVDGRNGDRSIPSESYVLMPIEAQCQQRYADAQQKILEDIVNAYANH